MANADDLLARRARLSEAKRALLERRLRGERPGRTAATTIPRRTEHGPAPLSYAQQRLWFLEQLMPGMDAYHLPASQRIRGPLRLDALEAAINEIIRRHKILRTTFPSVRGRPVQAVTPSLSLPLKLTDLSGADDAQRVLDDCAAEELHRPFDLARGPLIRCEVVRLGAEDHVLLLTMHHIVTDGWSMGVFFRELATLYEAFAAGRPSPMLELPLQYTDFAVWQEQRANSDEFRRQLGYWTTRLDGVANVDLPADRPRPPLQSYRGARDYMVLPLELVADLRGMSQAGQATLYMTMLAAFKALLSRYTGQEDITVGTAAAGRSHSELEGLIGFFVNTLVLRSDLSGDPTFTELADRVRNTALEAYSNQDVPFEMLVGLLHTRRDLSRTPLFQVFFNMVSYVDDPMDLAGLDIEPLPPAETPSKFDLTLYVAESDRGITLSLVYNTDIFDPERMAELLRQYQNLLWQIAKNPTQRISRYSLLTRRAAALLPCPCLPLPKSWHGSVQDRVSEHARRSPGSIAVRHAETSWTYRDLDELSWRVADALRQHGAGKGDVVAVHADRSARLVCALLGVLKIGAAFVILDSAYPAAVLIERVKAARAVACLDAAGAVSPALEAFLRDNPRRLRIPIRHLIESHAPRAVRTATYSRIVSAFEDVAYVAFTSGTTGQPKGIIGAHGPLAHFVRWHAERFGLTETDRFSMLSGLSHDPLLRDIFAPLWIGASVVIPTQEDIAGPGRLPEWLRREMITVSHLTPALTALLAQGGDEERLPRLRYAFFGGDVLKHSHVAQVRKRAPHATVVNFYGATETPQAMSYFVTSPTSDHDDSADPIPLGRGIEGAQLLILNRASSLAGTGELGGIYIRSPYLATGYLGDDALTRERFLPSPFIDDPSDRMYSTGDVGRYRPDGTVEFAGRADNQLKIRGFRVEPTEVEEGLCRHGAVRQACVIGQRASDESTHLLAYVVARDGLRVDRKELYEFLRDRLPEYMVPSGLVFVPALPLTPNGKIDRNSLPAIDAARLAIGTGAAVPAAGLEAALARMYSELLAVPNVAADDNFFALGGHSLLATQLLWRIRQQFEIDLPVRRLFEHPTPARLAEAIRELQREVPRREMPVLERAPRNYEGA